MSQSLDIEELTATYKLLGDETRLRLLALLRGNELAVGEIQKILGMGQSTLSSQLAQLKDLGILASRKEGQKVYYRIQPDANSPKVKLANAAVDQAASARWLARDKRHLEKILLEREESSRAFFYRQAVQYMTSPGQTWQALALGLIQLSPGIEKRIVDLGCGSGRLSRLFAEAGHRVTGVDNSEEQIKLAKKSSAGIKAGSLEFSVGTMEATKLPDASFEVALLSQSLHHAANPRDVLREAHRLCVPGGRILILDLLAHEEDWLRKKFSDFWLGFSESDLRGWLAEAGFRVNRFEITEPSPEYPDLEGVLAVGEK